MDPLYQLRMYEPERDYPLLKDWFEIHGSNPPPAMILPKLGAVCTKDGEDVAMLFLYMDNSCGVCRAEFPVTRPKLALRESRTALRHLFTYMRKVACDFNYPIMFVTTLPAIARFLEGMGFKTDMTGLVSMVGPTALPEEEDHGHGG